MKQPNKRSIIVGVIILWLIILGLSLRIIFDEKFDNFNKMIQARENAENKEEFDRNFEKMWKWFDEYKTNNPWSTTEDAEAAWKDIRGK